MLCNGLQASSSRLKITSLKDVFILTELKWLLVNTEGDI